MRCLAAFVLACTVVACHHDDPPPEMPSNHADVAPPPSRPAVDETTGVPACDEVIRLYREYFACDKFKAAGDAAMQAARDGFDAMKQGWESLKDAPPATKDAAATGCKQASDGLRQGAAAMGCPL